MRDGNERLMDDLLSIRMIIKNGRWMIRWTVMGVC